MQKIRAPWLVVLLALGCGAGNRDGVRAAQRLAGDAAADWRHQVIYLVMTDRFANGDPSNDEAGSPGCHDPADPQRFHGGDFAGLRAHLDYLQELGATAVWVTPVYRQIARLPNGHCGYHGYWADFVSPDDEALEPKLGSAADLTGLIGDLHARGMRFILDMVVNHTGDTARLPHQRPDWFHDPRDCARLGDPAIYCPLDHHPDFAQERPDVADYLDQVAAGWTSRFAIDGIRMDTARHVPPAYFHDHFLPAVRAVNPNLYTVGEVFQEGAASNFRPVLDAGFDGVFNFPLRRALVDAFAHGGSVDEVAAVVRDDLDTLGLDRTLLLANMVDNHDVQRWVDEPGYGVPEAEIRRRYLLALGALFTLPGIPQLYYGDELGLWGGPDPDNRHDLPAWAFDAAQRGAAHTGQALAASDLVFCRVQRLIALRREHHALADGSYTELWRQNGGRADVLAFLRATADDHVVVALNAGDAAAGPLPLNMPPSRLAEGTVLDDALGLSPSITVHAGRLPLSLPARAMAIYVVRAQP